MITVKKINSRQIILLGLCFIFTMVISASFTHAGVTESIFISEKDLGRFLRGYFEADLNNDGELETVKVIEPCRFFTNIPDSVWGDDTGTSIIIIDSRGNAMFWSEVCRYRYIEKLLVEDLDKDGFKEIVISVGQNKRFGLEAENFIFGCKDGVYKLINKK